MTTYPLSLPSSYKAAIVVPSLVFVNSETQSPYTMQEQFFSWPGVRWEFDVTIPPTNDRDVAEEFIAFAAQLRGRLGTFLMGDPAFPTPRGAWSGSPVVDGSGQTGNELLIRGATAGVTNYARIGDYIQIGTGLAARLYKVMANANSDGSGNVTLILSMDIRSGTADGSAIVTTDPKGLFRMSENIVSWGYDSNKMFRYSFRAVEAL